MANDVEANERGDTVEGLLTGLQCLARGSEQSREYGSGKGCREEERKEVEDEGNDTQSAGRHDEGRCVGNGERWGG